jgi:protein TonB
MAAIIRAHGVVKLHAIIATDGTIQSLNVIDGPPLLAEAAREAVRQWRYRPYILNGRPVEVETMITVNFKASD